MGYFHFKEIFHIVTCYAFLASQNNHFSEHTAVRHTTHILQFICIILYLCVCSGSIQYICVLYCVFGDFDLLSFDFGIC